MSDVAVAPLTGACQWPERRFSSIARQRKDVGHSDLELLSVFLDRGVIRYSESAGQVHKPSQDLSAYQRVLPGDLVMNNQQAWRGSVGVSRNEGIVSPAYLVWELSGTLDPRYAKYLFRSEPLRHQFVRASKGVGSIQRTVSLPLLKSAVVPVPSLEEQALLARYLDNIDLSISQAVRAKQEMQLLLLELKSAKAESWLLRGGPGAGPLEVSSDAPWLGELPSHWATIPCRYLFREVTRTDLLPSDPKLSLTRAAGLVRSSSLSTRASQESETLKYKRCAPGDLVLNKYRASLGMFASASERGLITPNYTVMAPSNRVDTGYYANLFNTPAFRVQWRLMSYGVGDGMMPLYTRNFYRVRSPLPPQPEQRRLLAGFNAASRHIDEALLAIEGEVALLHEYRTGLIADVVTGKLDVRAEAAALPEIDPEEIAEAQAIGGTEDNELEVAHAD